MSSTINGQGQYKVKSTGESVNYDFEYLAYESLEEMVSEIGEDKVFKNAQRMLKVDASNVAREKAKIENGHATRKTMSEADKSAAKAQRAEDKELLNRIKGLSAEQRAALGL